MTRKATPTRETSKNITKVIQPGHNQQFEKLGTELHKTLKRAGLGKFSVDSVHLTPLKKVLPSPNCKLVQQPDGSWKLVCS